MNPKKYIKHNGERYVLESKVEVHKLEPLVTRGVILICLFMLVFYYVSVIVGADEFRCKYNGLVCEFIKYPEIPKEDLSDICLLNPSVIGAIANQEQRNNRNLSDDFNLLP